MNRYVRPILCTAALLTCCTAALGITLTFDDLPPGVTLSQTFYRDAHRVLFDYPLETADHSGFTWGLPHSGTNVMIWPGSEYSTTAQVVFGVVGGASLQFDDVQSVSAFFSTKPGAIVQITAYRWTYPDVETPIASTVIGAVGECWDNTYVELAPAAGFFNRLEFQGVNSSDDLLGFCLDDMTITYVPEPSSLAALGLALAGVGMGRLRRRTR